MPNDWKTYKLGELYDSSSGLSKPREEFGFGNPFVTFKNVFYNYFLPDELSELANTNDKEVLRSSVLKGDLLLTRTSETLHELGMSSVALKDYPRATFNGFCKRLRLKKDIDIQIDPVFMGFYLRSNKFRSEVSKHSTMTTRASLNNNSIASLEIDLPPYPEQVRIGELLKSILDKIELNLQMNKTLEEMAMALYKHWFIDFEFPSSGGVAEGRGGEYTQQFEGRGGKKHPKDTSKVPRNTKNFMSLPYNPKLKQRARELRKAGNLAEVLFWQQVHKGKFKGLDFDRQKIIGNYIVDFYCGNVNVVVEIDGSSHDNKQEYDAIRDAYLQSLGLTVIHITDTEVKNNLANTIEGLKAHPAFQAPLQRRGSAGYKSSGGKFVDSELGMIPEGWEVKRIDEISSKKSETFDFSNKQEVVFVNTGDVQEGRFLHSNYISKIGLPGQAKKAIAQGDILYSEIRPKNKRFAFVNFDASDYVVSTKFMIINPKENILNKLLYRMLTMQLTVSI